MSKHISIIGNRYKTFLVLSRSEKPEHIKRSGQAWYKCKCDCGRIKICESYALRKGIVRCVCQSRSAEVAIEDRHKICSECKQDLSIEKFSIFKCKSRNNRMKVRSTCKKCTKKIRRERYLPKAKDRIAIERCRSIAKLRREVFSAYGGPKCACCGTEFDMFLTIDHANGDGKQHRAELNKTVKRTTSTSIYRWLRRNKFPPGFRVLCFNCNYAVHRLGQDIDLLREMIKISSSSPSIF